MVKMSGESKEFLKQHLPSCVDAEKPNDILAPLYDLIEYQGFDSEYAYNEFGFAAQRVYDDIFYSNFD